jgi:hypothetical protein
VEVVSQPLGLRLGVAGAAAFLGLLFFFASASPFDSMVIRSAGLLLAAIAAIRAFRLCIRADRREIVVRNFFRSHRLRWEDVREVGIGPGWSSGSTNLTFVTRDGRAIRATATTNRPREQTRVLRELAELRSDLPDSVAQRGVGVDAEVMPKALGDRLPLLKWLVLPAAAVFVTAVAPESWRLWLALVFATWWLVGFIVARWLWREESLAVALVLAPIAPFQVLLYSPIMLAYAWKGRTVTKMRAEFQRIGADDVRVDGVFEGGSVNLYDVRPGRTNFNWDGSADEALNRLRSVPDGAGRDGLWNVFPERTTPPFRALYAELERIGGGKRVPIAHQFQGMTLTDPVRLFDAWEDEAREIEWEWEGITEEALGRLRRVRDGAGRDGFWDAFPDKTRTYFNELTDAIMRISGDGPACVSWRDSESGDLSLEDFPSDPLPHWTWKGSIEDGLERLRTIPDGAGRDGLWEAFPDKVPSR